MKLFALSFVFCSLQSLASSFFVGIVKSPENDGQLAQTVRSLMTASIVNAGGKPAETESSADYTLNANLDRLGPAYVLTITRSKAAVAQYSARQKANSVQELDEATDRAVRAAMVGNPTRKDTRVGEVTEKQSQEMQTRIKSKNSAYVGFGPANFLNMGVAQLSYDFALGYIWGVAPQWDVRTILDVVVSGDWKTSLTSGTLGLDYYFTDQDSAPYVTGGLGFGLSGSTAASVTTIGGFTGSLGLGYELFRTSNTQFDVALTYNSIFANNGIGNPSFASFRIGVLF